MASEESTHGADRSTTSSPSSLPPLTEQHQSDRHVRLLEPDGYASDGDQNWSQSQSENVRGWPQRPHTAGGHRHVDKHPPPPKSSRHFRRIVKNGDEEIMSPKEQRRLWSHQSLRARERTYDVNLVTTHMPLYEPLLDEYLVDYFNSPKIRKHLVKLGLVDDEGNIMDSRQFKCNQIRLDRMEHESQIMKKMEEREMDRAVETAIRQQNEEDRTPRSQKLRKTVEAPHSSLPYPDFLAHYPSTMTRTALLYSEKPAPLTTAEQMVVAKLKQQTPRKLKALGISPAQLHDRDIHSQEVARKEREAIWKSGPTTSRYRKDHGGTGPPPLRQDKKQTMASVRNGDAWDRNGGQRDEDEESLSHLFDVAKKEYKEGKLEEAESHIRKILHKVEEKEGKQAWQGQERTDNLPKGLFADDRGSSTESPNLSQVILDRDVLRTRSGRSTPSTPRHRALRPKSARPTRQSHFPVATDFSDFDAGSEGGYESDGDVFLSDELDPHALAGTGSRNENSMSMAEDVEGMLQEVVEQSTVPPDPMTDERDSGLQQYTTKHVNEHSGSMDLARNVALPLSRPMSAKGSRNALNGATKSSPYAQPQSRTASRAASVSSLTNGQSTGKMSRAASATLNNALDGVASPLAQLGSLPASRTSFSSQTAPQIRSRESSTGILKAVNSKNSDENEQPFGRTNSANFVAGVPLPESRPMSIDNLKQTNGIRSREQITGTLQEENPRNSSQNMKVTDQTPPSLPREEVTTAKPMSRTASAISLHRQIFNRSASGNTLDVMVQAKSQQSLSGGQAPSAHGINQDGRPLSRTGSTQTVKAISSRPQSAKSVQRTSQPNSRAQSLQELAINSS
ncbi:hypothetical protein SpCBS45565_g08423 [Spizellomyces sp. 'palustris']|nr:hypothetical protein SpCBS45565_g08423 [Spizellomyces sp. 'palustris']